MTDLINIGALAMIDDLDAGYCANCGDYREVDLVVVNGNVYCDDECAASGSLIADSRDDDNPGYNHLR